MNPALSHRKDKVIERKVVVERNGRRFWGLPDEAEDILNTVSDVFADHKSCEDLEASIYEVTTPVCSLCDSDWDPIRDEDSGVVVCPSCGVPIES